MQNGSLYARVEAILRVWAGLYIPPQYRACALAVQDGCYPTEVATAMRQKRMPEGRWKLSVWTRPQER